MRRILVPLDGTHFATRVLPEACRLAGPEGVVILVEDLNGSRYRATARTYGEAAAVDEATTYLEDEAHALRAHGVEVETHLLPLNDTPLAIDEAARVYQADLIACATHGRTPMRRLLRGGVAWRAVAHSTVPVLLHHFENGPSLDGVTLAPPRIMVPLDGSTLAESALPLAAQVAQEWHAEIWLVQVIPDVDAPNTLYRPYAMSPADYAAERAAIQAYLDSKIVELAVPVHTAIFVGNVIEILVRLAHEWGISHVVMASHGRTGIPRVILGSVADALVHRLTVPILVIPALAAHSVATSSGAEGRPAMAK